MIPNLRRPACLSACAALLPLGFVLGLAACAPPAAETPAGDAAAAAAPLTEGDWTLDPADSRLSYVSIKAGELAETNGFDTLAGTVAADGSARLEIDLASVNTGVEIRDERMRKIFFDVINNPKAEVTAALRPNALAGLAVGDTLAQPLEANVTIKGVSQTVRTDVLVTRVSADRVTVVPTAPVIISTDMFGLTDELGELRALAELPSITPAVPVSFVLTFRRSANTLR